MFLKSPVVPFARLFYEDIGIFQENAGLFHGFLGLFCGSQTRKRDTHKCPTLHQKKAAVEKRLAKEPCIAAQEGCVAAKDYISSKLCIFCGSQTGTCRHVV